MAEVELLRAEDGLSMEDLSHIKIAWAQRYQNLRERHQDIDEILTGSYVARDPNGDPIEGASPNMIQVGISDTAEAAGIVPTIRVNAYKNTQEVKESAHKMEKIGVHYLGINSMDLAIPQAIMDMAAYGLCAFVVRPDFSDRVPRIERRDPRTCYPEPGFQLSTNVRRCLFVREVFVGQLPTKYRLLLMQDKPELGNRVSWWLDNTKVTILEYFDTNEYILAGSYEGQKVPSLSPVAADHKPTEFERIQFPQSLKACPVVVGARLTADGEFRGQFDQAIDIQKAYAKLQAILMEHADQSVYSDYFVRDAIGEVSFGGGSYIQLGPNGLVGRVPPANPHLSVFNDLVRMEEGIHLAGRWPKSRPGEIDQSIASAKFLEASAGMMNTVIKLYHQIMADVLERILTLCFKTDKTYFPEPRTISGLLANQEFLEPYSASDIDLNNAIRAHYGLGLGRDPAQTAVLMIQYHGNKLLSKRSVMENIEGITNVGTEEARLDVEDFTEIMKGKMLQLVQTGGISDRALLEIARARSQGEDVWELFEEHVVQPLEEQLQNALPSGFGSPPAGGGPPALGPGGAPPPGPGGPVPEAPTSTSLNRLATGVPGLGGRSVIGTDIRRGS